MSGPIAFERGATCSTNNARIGCVSTPHGSFQTPAFMPVATAAAMKGVLPNQVRDSGAEIILNNAYHLMLRPGVELIKDRGGTQKFMRWDGPVLTDSGGYQAFSMADINAIDEEGVTFRSFVSGEKIHLGPERSMEVQNAIGADIIMAFDDCPPSPQANVDASSPRARLPKPKDWAARRVEAHERTLRWLERSIAAHARKEEQGLFGIVQGGTDLDLRTASVEGVCSHDLPGYAIGGVAVGEGPEEIKMVVEHTAVLLPVEKPKYLMGVGYERDIVMAVAAGVDMFDCVLPTRNGRMASVFTRKGRIRLRNAKFRTDPLVIEEGCDCPACGGGFSRAYLRHCFLADEMLGPILCSLHNLRHFQHLLLDIRRAIADDSWSSLYDRWPVLGGETAGAEVCPHNDGQPVDNGGSLEP
jgi:queuine tRNA-ribosyltransferase